MNEPLPAIEEPYLADGGGTPTPWEELWPHLAAADGYVLSTVQPSGHPHAAPVLGVWCDGRLHVAMSPTSRKARSLAVSPSCVATTRHDGLDIVVEGVARRVRGEALERVADVYADKYGWRVEVRDDLFTETEGAPTAGPPPYRVLAILPTTVFAFPLDDRHTPTRWRFHQDR